MNEQGEITDSTRIERALPTIVYLLDHGAKVILMSHLGRPTPGAAAPKTTLKPAALVLEKLLGRPVRFADVHIDECDSGVTHALADGEVLLLENTRLNDGEKTNDPAFVKHLAAFGDCFVNDAFASWQPHASTFGVAQLLPSAAGLLMEQEFTMLGQVLEAPKRPFVAILGGAKISTKLGVIRNLLPKVDSLLIGGAIANNVLAAQKIPVGKSEVEPEALKLIEGMTDNKLRLPLDVLISKRVNQSAGVAVHAVGSIEPDDIIYDIGPETVELYSRILRGAKTIVWNGPLGLFEESAFANGTAQIARVIAGVKAYTVAGGGETIEALKQLGLEGMISFVSTGGGAMLKVLEGSSFPCVDVLPNRS